MMYLRAVSNKRTLTLLGEPEVLVDIGAKYEDEVRWAKWGWAPDFGVILCTAYTSRAKSLNHLCAGRVWKFRSTASAKVVVASTVRGKY